MKKRLLFTNGLIFTASPEQPEAEAMIVFDGKVEWIGFVEDIPSVSIDKTINLKKQRVIPGLIDAHLHPLYLADSVKQIACTPPLVQSIEGMVQQIHLEAAKPGGKEWIEGWGYDEGKLAEGKAPTRYDLDRGASERPVVITRTCAHIMAVNSKALELAGITKDTPDPPGGKIDRDEYGEPTGVLRESAKDLVKKVMPARTVNEDAESLAMLGEKLLAKGITAITDLMALVKKGDYFDLYEKARAKGLRQRTVLYYLWEEMKDHPVLDKEKLNRNQPVYVGGVKLFADGSVSGQTAWVQEPFEGTSDNYGIQTTDKEELLAGAEAAKQNGIQLAVHAMGEQAINLIIDTFHNVPGWLEDAPSIRIEHASLPTKQAIQRAAEANIAIVTQPIFLYAEIESYLKNLGTKRTLRSYPIRSLLDAGAPVAFSSDAPATACADPVDPFAALKSAVTRLAYDGTDTGQDERVDARTAVELYTRRAQEITRIPFVGQLKPGYHADFVVLNRDLLLIDPVEIDQVSVKETYMAGELVYQKEAAVFS